MVPSKQCVYLFAILASRPIRSATPVLGSGIVEFLRSFPRRPLLSNQQPWRREMSVVISDKKNPREEILQFICTNTFVPWLGRRHVKL